MKLLQLLCLFLLITSCNQRKEDNSDPLTGTWEYEKIEQLNGEPIDLADSAYSALHRQHYGLSFSFSKGETFKVTQRRPDNTEEFIAEQPYELPEDRKNLRLINKGRPDDLFPIISISDSLLKINVFKSPFAYIVFRKK